MIITLASLGGFFYAKSTGSDISSLGWLPLGSLVIFVLSFSLGFGMLINRCACNEIKVASIFVLPNNRQIFVFFCKMIRSDSMANDG